MDVARLIMMNFLGVMALGFFLGMRHASDPDHVIAVTTIVSQRRTVSGAAAIGAAWGLGHTLTILAVGTGIIVFGWVIPPRLGLSTELSVGLMLILLGVMNLTGVLTYLRQSAAGRGALRHPHSHDTDGAPLGWLDRHFGALGPYRLVRPLLVGIVHGLAGSAAVALLVLATIKDPTWAVVYLLLFGLGTIVGMMVMTAAIVLPFAYTDRRFTGLNSGFRMASGILSVLFGLFIAYRIGFVDGLFTGHANWTPQ
jgi:high-affinity nickel permease